MNKNKGFTLIELLVVIAIIGILAAVVLASLSSARDKGKDAAVKSQLSSMRAQAELYYSTGDKYWTSATVNICKDDVATFTGAFGGTSGLLAAVQASEGLTTTIDTAGTTAGAYNVITCNSTTDAWAVSAPLTASKSGTPSMYCVDSLGASKATGTLLGAGATVCP